MSIAIGKFQNLVSHPTCFARLEVTEPDLNFAVTCFHYGRKKLVHDCGLIFREKEICNRCTARLFDAVEPHHLQSGSIDKEGNSVQIAHANEVSTVLNECDKLFSVCFSLFAIRDVSACGRQKNNFP